MRLDVSPPDAATVRAPQVVFAPPPDTRGTLTVHPGFAGPLSRAGLTCAAAFLELPGEVVSGHADRHVMRAELPGAPHAFYLKRQHVVGWPERLRNRRAGFGWVSRCEREATLLAQLEAEGLPAPRWVAYGTHGGRAFLLVEEVPGALDLRRLLAAGALSREQRLALAARIGAAVAAVHAAGFTTPDLTAKHVLVHPRTLRITFLDWQSAARPGAVPAAARADALGALHASLAPGLAAPADRLRVLAAYRESARHPAPVRAPAGPRGPGWHEPVPLAPDPRARDANRDLTARALRAAERHAPRRSVRDQLQPEGPAQRLVWLAGEAVCAIPEVAALWPAPVIGPPFYGFGADGAMRVRVAGREAVLVRGRATAPLGRLRAWLRAAPWRSTGATIGRLLFHLQRYNVPAPQLFAFGQRLTSATGAEWFALYEAPPGVPLRKWRHTASSPARLALLASAAECLDRLHAAGCVLLDPKNAFAVTDGRASVGDPRAVRIVRRVSPAARRRDRRALTRLLGVE